MNSKEIALGLAEAFNNNDVDAISHYLTDDGEWNMLGDKVYKGKESIQAMFSSHSDMKIINCTFDHVIAEGNTVAIDGYVECEGKSGQKISMFYCDIYEIEGSKVKKMTSYVIDRKL